MHPEKTPSPILVTELGIVTEKRLVQLLKASFPILVTEYFEFPKVIDSGITMLPEYSFQPEVTEAVVSEMS